MQNKKIKFKELIEFEYKFCSLYLVFNKYTIYLYETLKAAYFYYLELYKG